VMRGASRRRRSSLFSESVFAMGCSLVQHVEAL
jgi:hypothetical protein